jgi:low affinity Fe/Cu permease
MPDSTTARARHVFRSHHSRFGRIAAGAAKLAGHPLAFGCASLTIILWALAGPMCRYSDTWQMTINTGTTIVTFLMIFLLQNSQNRESISVQIKLDEIIRAIAGAHNALLDLENLDQKELEAVRATYEKLASAARQQIEQGGDDIDTPAFDGPDGAG